MKSKEKLLNGHEAQDTSPATEFANVLSSVTKTKEDNSKKKKMDRMSKSLTSFYKRTKKTGGKMKIT